MFVNYVDVLYGTQKIFKEKKQKRYIIAIASSSKEP